MKIIHLLTAFLLVAAPVSAQGAFLGVQVSSAESGGVQLKSVNPDTAADLMGLKPGDQLLSLDGEAVAGVDDFVKRIGQRLPGEIVRFELVRDGQSLSLRGVLGRRPSLRGLRVPAVPGQHGVPQPLEIPDLPNLPNLEFPGLPEFPELATPFQDPDLWQDLRQGQAGPFRSLREHLRQLEEDGWPDLTEPWDGHEFRFRIEGLGEGTEREVHVRYPASTPEEKREKLIRDAKEKYGEDAEVVFEGEGSSISIVTRSRFGMGEDAQGDLLNELRQGGVEPHDLPSAGWEESEEEPEKVTIEELIEEPVLQDAETQDAETHSIWHDSLEQALAAARKSGKPVLVDFSAKWCGPCRQLGSQLLHNPEHAGLIARFEPVQIDIDQHADLAREYEVGGIPDLRVLRPDGQQVHKVVGFGGVEAAIRQLEIGLEKASAEGQDQDPKVEKLKEHHQDLRRELEEAHRQLKELRKEVGGGQSSSGS